MMNMTYHVVIGVEILRIDSGGSLDKEFTELIHKNPLTLLHLISNQVGSCHGCICGHLT